MDTTGLTLYSLEAEEKTFLAAFSMPEVCCFLLLLLHTNTNKSSFSAEQWVFLHSHMQIPCISSPQLTDASFYWEEEEVWLPYADFRKGILHFYLEILAEEAGGLCTCVWHF